MRDYEAYANDYLHEDNSFEHFAVKIRRNVVLQRISSYNSKRILEVGCGFDSIFNYLSCEEGCIIEPSRKFIDRSRQRLKSKDKILIYNTSLEESGVELCNYDFILLSGVLHEMEDVTLVFELLRKSSKNAVIHINVPNKNSLHRILGVRMELTQSCGTKSTFNERYQIQDIYCLEDLITLAQAKNFKILSTGFYGFKPFTHIQMRELAHNKYFGAAVVEALYSASDLFAEYSAEFYIELKQNS